MNILRMVLMVLLMAVPCSAWAAELGLVRLSLVSGDVQVQAEDADEWVPAVANMPLADGDRIWVPAGGRAELQMQYGVYLRLDARTALDIVELQEESFQFYLAEGRAYINNRKGGIDHIQVDTPHASAGIFDNSLVMVDVGQGGVTDVSVIKGYALVETERGKTRVVAGNALRLTDGTGAVIAPIEPPDAWETWNRSRDNRLVDSAESLRYVPDELDDYARDLDDYGRWHYVQEYGYVWTPRGSLPANWSPYRQGRWAWVRGNYVWISYEPWGWVPYHYGRWAFSSRIGWCWVPPSRGAVSWGPGYVGWVYTPTSVAWVPLAPGEVYYGYGSFGPLSVNITNAAIPRTVVRDYRNVHVRNAVTIIHRDTFLSGRKQRVTVRQNPFTVGDASVGPPRFRPERETRLPVIKSIPAGHRPPERLKRLKVEEIRRERRLVPSEKGSVFTPGRQPDNLRVLRREAPRRTVVNPPPPAVRDQAVQGAQPQQDRTKDTMERKRRSPGGPVRVPGRRLEERPVKPPTSPPPVAAPPATRTQSQPVTSPPATQRQIRQERPVKPPTAPPPVTQGQSQPVTAPSATPNPPRQERPAAAGPHAGRGEGRSPLHRGGEKREMREQGATTAPAPAPAQKTDNAQPDGARKMREKGEKEERQ